MIINFSFENWMSFRDKAVVSAIAGRQVTHNERISRLKKYKMRILPVLAIYGGNASGKSNIFKALEFVNDLVVDGTEVGELIKVRPFLLSPKFRNKPSRFWIELLINEKVYAYSFAVTSKDVCEEKLVEIRPTTEKVLFERKNRKFNIFIQDKGGHLNYISKGTRSNQLFLTNCIEQNNEKFAHIYKWFSKDLKLIAPESRFGNLADLLDKKLGFYQQVNKMLGELDTGISRLGSEDVEDEIIKNMLEKGFRSPELIGGLGERYFRNSESESDSLKKLVLFHKSKGHKEVKFNPRQESEGTMRLIELLPVFIMCELTARTKGKAGIVSFVDELDRSMHYLLLRRLLERMLSSFEQDCRSQLIFTTHDLLLMDQELLRRDEMLLVERNNYGVSSIVPLDEYKGVRFDKDIRKSYLQGRFGGIPKL